MLNKSHESKLSAFGLDKTIDRWNRVYYSYPNAILTALHKGNPNMFNEDNQKGQASRNIYAGATTSLSSNQDTYPTAANYQTNEALINEAAGHVLSRLSTSTNQANHQPAISEAPLALPIDQAELIRNAQADVEAARNWVPGQPSSLSGVQPIAQQFADQSSIETALPLTEAQIEQQQLIRYAQQGVQEAHEWLAGQSTEPRL